MLIIKNVKLDYKVNKCDKKKLENQLSQVFKDTKTIMLYYNSLVILLYPEQGI